MGWVGALAVFLAHGVASLTSGDEEIVRAASIAMGLTAWLVIMPLSVATVITGVVQALSTAWGLVKHYWIVFKLLLTAVATGVLLLKLQPISALAETARAVSVSSGDLMGLRTSLTIHAAGGLLVLLATLILAIYKPAGLTPYGARKPGLIAAPSWVKVAGAVLAVFAVLFLAMALFGTHGPSTHLPH